MRLYFNRVRNILYEITVALLGLLLGQYFVMSRITFVATGAYTHEPKGSTEFQADLSYNFEADKEISDLCYRGSGN